MRRVAVSIFLIVIVLLSGATLVYASVNDMSLQDAIKSFIRYDFNAVKEIADTGKNPGIEDTARESAVLTTFEPVNVDGGWLFDLAGGGRLEVGIGTLEFDDGALSERYIDIKGQNGEVRFLRNSFSAGSEYNKTLFWSFKQQEGASIVKGSTGEIKCAVLFELSNGAYCLYGYIDGEDADFWSLELPETGYYFADKPSETAGWQSTETTAQNNGESSMPAVKPKIIDNLKSIEIENLNDEKNSKVILSLAEGWYAKKLIFDKAAEFEYNTEKNKQIKEVYRYEIYNSMEKDKFNHYDIEGLAGEFYVQNYYRDQPESTRFPNHCQVKGKVYTGDTVLGEGEIFILDCDLPRELRTEKYSTYDRVYVWIPIENEALAYNLSINVPLGEKDEDYVEMAKTLLKADG